MKLKFFKKLKEPKSITLDLSIKSNIVNDMDFKNTTFIYCLDFDGNIIHKVGPSRANYYEPYKEQLYQVVQENSTYKIDEYNLFDIEHNGLATLIKESVNWNIFPKLCIKNIFPVH